MRQNRNLKVNYTVDSAQSLKNNFGFGLINVTNQDLSDDDAKECQKILISIMDETGLEYKLDKEYANACIVNINGNKKYVKLTDKFTIGYSNPLVLDLSDPDFTVEFACVCIVLYYNQEDLLQQNIAKEIATEIDRDIINSLMNAMKP